MFRIKHVPLPPMDDDSVHSLKYDDSDDEDNCSVASRSVCSLKRYSVLRSPSSGAIKCLARVPSEEQSFNVQLRSLSGKERFAVEVLRIHWESENQPLPSMMYMYFARFYNFDVKPARKAMEKFDQRLLHLCVEKLEPILQERILFPVHGLKSKDGLDMFYMRPARYFPKQLKSKHIADNLAYVMSTMIEKVDSSINGIGFLACMDDWTTENFSASYCRQFMTILQGGVPAKVQLFLIVNPPKSFRKMYKLMKSVLDPEFFQRVKLVNESELTDYLAAGYKRFLPDDMMTGEANTRRIVDGFIADRQHRESSY